MKKIILYVHGFVKYSPLLVELVKRSIKVRYRHSVLGMLWTVLNPLLSMIVLTIVFSSMFKMEIDNFALYVLIGNIVFGFNSEASTQGMISIVSNASLIKKVYIPKYLFPLSYALSCLVNFGFSMIAMVVVMIFTKATFHLEIFTFVIPLMYLFLFSFGLGLILCVANVFFRDTLHLYGIVTTIWMYFSAIFYSVDIMPENVRFAVEINPMYKYISFFRCIIMDGAFPDFNDHLCCIVWSVSMLMVGLSVFYKAQNKFILHI